LPPLVLKGVVDLPRTVVFLLTGTFTREGLIPREHPEKPSCEGKFTGTNRWAK